MNSLVRSTRYWLLISKKPKMKGNSRTYKWRCRTCPLSQWRAACTCKHQCKVCSAGQRRIGSRFRQGERVGRFIFCTSVARRARRSGRPTLLWKWRCAGPCRSTIWCTWPTVRRSRRDDRVCSKCRQLKLRRLRGSRIGARIGVYKLLKIKKKERTSKGGAAHSASTHFRWLCTRCGRSGWWSIKLIKSRRALSGCVWCRTRWNICGRWMSTNEVVVAFGGTAARFAARRLRMDAVRAAMMGSRRKPNGDRRAVEGKG